MKIIVEIAKSNSAWVNHKTLNKHLMKKLITNILNRFANLKTIDRFELSVLFATNQEMLDLNNKFRGKHKTTNILSFPDIELNWQQLVEFKPNQNYMYLGDIAFCYQVIQNEAINKNISFEEHFIHLFVHGILHLIGFDHQDDNDASAMEKLEIDVLKDFAIASPY